ncbi:MAG: WG repeat-containing protein [Opitutaceae bacterium]
MKIYCKKILLACCSLAVGLSLTSCDKSKDEEDGLHVSFDAEVREPLPWPYDSHQIKSYSEFPKVGELVQEARYSTDSGPERMVGVTLYLEFENTGTTPMDVRIKLIGRTEYESRGAETGKLTWGGEPVTKTFRETLKPGVNEVSCYVDTLSTVEASGAGGAIGLLFGAVMTGSNTAGSMLHPDVEFQIFLDPDDTDAWDRASKVNTIDAYRKYLPLGATRGHRDEAVAAVETLREEQFYSKFVAMPCLASARDYIQNCKQLREIYRTTHARKRYQAMQLLLERLEDPQTQLDAIRQVFITPGSTAAIREMIHAEYGNHLPVATWLTWHPYESNSAIDEEDFELAYIKARNLLLANRRVSYEQVRKLRFNVAYPSPRLSAFTKDLIEPRLKLPQAPELNKGEFETLAEFEAKKKKQAVAYENIVSDKRQEYAKRKGEYDAKVAKAKQDHGKAHSVWLEKKNTFDGITGKINGLSPTADALRTFLAHDSFSYSLGTYDAERGVFPATIECKQFPELSISGEVAVARNIASQHREKAQQYSKLEFRFLEQDDKLSLVAVNIVDLHHDVTLPLHMQEGSKMLTWNTSTVKRERQDYKDGDISKLREQDLKSYLTSSWHTGQYTDRFQIELQRIVDERERRRLEAKRIAAEKERQRLEAQRIADKKERQRLAELRRLKEEKQEELRRAKAEMARLLKEAEEAKKAKIAKWEKYQAQVAEIVVKRGWDQVFDFSEGLARIDGAFYDRDGKRVLSQTPKHQYPRVDFWGSQFHGGLLSVQRRESSVAGSQWGYIDQSGNFLGDRVWQSLSDTSRDKELSFRDHYNFIDGYAIVFGQIVPKSRELSKYYVINREGDLILKRSISFLSEGMFAFKKRLEHPYHNDYAYGFVNARGEIVVQPVWDKAMPFSEGYAAVSGMRVSGAKSQSKDWGFIDKQGKIVIPPAFVSVGKFSGGLCAVWKRTSNNRHSLGYINSSNKVIIEFNSDWREAGEFSEGFASVKKGHRYLFIDKSGKDVFRKVWEDTKEFSQGFAAVKLGGKWGIIDTKGEIFSKCMWDDVGPFQEGFARVRKDEKEAFLGLDGKVYFLKPEK